MRRIAGSSLATLSAMLFSHRERSSGPGDVRLRGVLTRLRAGSLTEESADWLMSLQVDKIPPNLCERVAAKGMYLFSTHKEEWRRNKQKPQSLNNQGGRQIATIRAKISVPMQKTPKMTRRADCLGAPTCAADPAA